MSDAVSFYRDEGHKEGVIAEENHWGKVGAKEQGIRGGGEEEEEEEVRKGNDRDEKEVEEYQKNSVVDANRGRERTRCSNQERCLYFLPLRKTSIRETPHNPLKERLFKRRTDAPNTYLTRENF